MSTTRTPRTLFTQMGTWICALLLWALAGGSMAQVEPSATCLQSANQRMAEWMARMPAEKRPTGAVCRCVAQQTDQEDTPLDIRMAMCTRPWVKRYTQERALIEFTDILTQEFGWSLREVKTLARCAGQMRSDTLVDDVRHHRDPDLMAFWVACVREAGHPDQLLPLPIPKDLRVITPGAR